MATTRIMPLHIGNPDSGYGRQVDELIWNHLRRVV